jgi:hypothetical protein
MSKTNLMKIAEPKRTETGNDLTQRQLEAPELVQSTKTKDLEQSTP